MKKKNKRLEFAVIIEARSNSSRLPRKHLKKVFNKTIIEYMIERLKNSKLLEDIVVSTTVNKTDDELVKLLKKNDIKYFRGSENDVLFGVLETAEFYNIKNIVEIPGDCPLIDPYYVDLYIGEFKKKKIDYLSSGLSKNFPNGFEVQIFPTKILRDVSKKTNCEIDREHVSLFIYNNPDLYKIHSVESPFDRKYKSIKLTLDTKKDLKLITKIIKKLYPNNKRFGLTEIINEFYC